MAIIIKADNKLRKTTFIGGNAYIIRVLKKVAFDADKYK